MTHAGFVAILGEPNVGKSTLLNQVLGQKIAITSPKVQTTRQRMLGIGVWGENQVIFIDTPGIFEAKRPLEKAIVQNATKSFGDADVFLILVDARYLGASTQKILQTISDYKRPIFLVFNKVDLLPDKLALLPKIDALRQDHPNIQEIFMISALKKEGLDDLTTTLCRYLPESPWLFPEDQVTTMPLRLWSAEITREQLYYHLEHELPYETYIETESFEYLENGGIKIQQAIIVARDSQKGIVLGRKGQKIKAIGEKARRELQKLLEKRVHLFLFVKVKEKWMENQGRLRELGLQ